MSPLKPNVGQDIFRNVLAHCALCTATVHVAHTSCFASCTCDLVFDTSMFTNWQPLDQPVTYELSTGHHVPCRMQAVNMGAT